jgi:hypothetical protein
MEASKQIREAMARVSELRQMASDAPELALAVHAIKQIQASRFAGTYQDLLDSPIYCTTANFFLTELYSERDYSLRDAQFSRIAGALELTFPDQVVSTAVALAKLHCLTEELDMAMAQCWLTNTEELPTSRYCFAWQMVGQRTKRNWQLATVLDIGLALDQLTRKRGLRLMLKMMRRPAGLAGLGSFQMFLESGFDRFSGIGRNGGSVQHFLSIVKARESDWLDLLFENSDTHGVTHLDNILNRPGFRGG